MSGSCTVIVLPLISEDLFEHLGISFKAVHQALQVFEAMELRSEFVTLYRENRKLQSNLVLHFTSTDWWKNYPRIFTEIAGFFITEDTIMKVVRGLTSGHGAAGLRDASVGAVGLWCAAPEGHFAGTTSTERGSVHPQRAEGLPAPLHPARVAVRLPGRCLPRVPCYDEGPLPAHHG